MVCRQPSNIPRCPMSQHRRNSRGTLMVLKGSDIQSLFMRVPNHILLKNREIKINKRDDFKFYCL